MQQQYTDIPDLLHVCICKADELSIRKGLSGKCKDEFTPRWLKREKNKTKLCCVPGCSVGYELGVHVALRPLRQSVLLVMLVFDCCPREYPAMWPASSCLASFPGSHALAGRKEPGTHCLRMLSYPRISGNLEISHKTCSVTLTSVRALTSLVYKLPATEYALCGR